MLIRAIKPFYVGYNLITLGRTLDLHPVSAALHVAHGECVYVVEPEAAVMPAMETATMPTPKRKRISK